MSSEKLVMDQGFVPSLAGVGLTRPYKRQGGRRTGLVLLAGGCLGGVLVCAVLMPLVYVTMSDLQLEVTELKKLMHLMRLQRKKLRRLHRNKAASSAPKESCVLCAELFFADNVGVDLSATTSRPAPTASPATDAAEGGAHRERRQADLTPAFGDVYVRWGREKCGENAETIYAGVVGSGYHHHHGGGNDYQCLPLEGVEWNKPVAGNQHNSYMYGTEYQVSSGYFSTDNMESITNPYNYDVPCSVCLVSGRSAHVMIPARLSCPQGWSKEYSGYLMSAYHGHYNNKNFICVDGAPNLVPGSAANNDQALLYLVEAQCGSLPCGPYISGYELTCVVCTK
ncbi:hypothetical protein Bbelb_267340 [Branchiostoma belcheri]|nr:hypothetical protein Bbelb_267340 [Branchiostoma belcheri]